MPRLVDEPHRRRLTLPANAYQCLYDESMLPLASVSSETLRPLRRSEYDRLVELGEFEDERLELLYGQLVTMSPQGTPHAYVIGQLTQLLVPALLGRALVRVQLPWAASNISEPEPDLAVVPPGVYLDDHPQRAYLVIEVAGDSLRKDQELKGRLYAESGVPEYWVVDLQTGCVEVRRGPSARGYRRCSRHGREDTLRLLQFPDVALALVEVLPPPGKVRTARRSPGSSSPSRRRRGGEGRG